MAEIDILNGNSEYAEITGNPANGARTLNTVALVATYVPRQCGIGMFTKDLRDAIAGELGDRATMVIALDDTPAGYSYPKEVGFQIRAHQQSDYQLAADYLNINEVDVALIQHEFGIYGGADGNLLLELMPRLRMPIVSTLHTILVEPTKTQERVMQEVIRLSDRIVVMSRRATEILDREYDVPAEKMAIIPHGIPDVPFEDPNFYKDHFGVEGRKVILTFGLLSPGKGIETVIEALPDVMKENPEAMYVVLGATHPHVLRTEGDGYRASLQLMVDRLGLKENVVFQNRFVGADELHRFIGAADVCVTPYLNREQITSGVLVNFMGMGKAVVSTPYWHAEEALADGRGMLFPFRDSKALAARINELFAAETERHAMRKRAYLYTRSMVWPEVARAYANLGRAVIHERQLRPRPAMSARRHAPRVEAIPEIDLRHLRTLTDGTGIFQHAKYTVPDRTHGYCTDDNARALVVAMSYYDLRRDESVLPLVKTYLSFIGYAFDEGRKRFRNCMTYDRRWFDDEFMNESGMEDVHGRALWGLGLTVAYAQDEGTLAFAARMFLDGLTNVEEFTSPRAWAFTLVGIHAYLERFGGDATVRRVRKSLGDRLHEHFRRHAKPDWPWCEDMLTYDNAKLPHALILAGQWLFDQEMFQQGIRSLEWLLEVQNAPEGHLTPIGNRGWMTRSGERARFDQQPIEVMALVEACAEAYRCTHDRKWLVEVRRCLGWFLGQNDVHAMLYDFRTGGCRDGLHPDGANDNEGAESTLSWLHSLVTAHQALVEETLDADGDGARVPARETGEAVDQES